MDGGVYKINSVGHILFFIDFVFLDINSLSIFIFRYFSYLAYFEDFSKIKFMRFFYEIYEIFYIILIYIDAYH